MDAFPQWPNTQDIGSVVADREDFIHSRQMDLSRCLCNAPLPGRHCHGRDVITATLVVPVWPSYCKVRPRPWHCSPSFKLWDSKGSGSTLGGWLYPSPLCDLNPFFRMDCSNMRNADLGRVYCTKAGYTSLNNRLWRTLWSHGWRKSVERYVIDDVTDWDCQWSCVLFCDLVCWRPWT